MQYRLTKILKFLPPPYLAVYVVSMLILCGCFSESRSRPFIGPVEPAVLVDSSFDVSSNAKTQNCLFIVLDALHAKHLSAWGYDRVTSPNLDLIAEKGVRFSYAYSQAPSTIPSTWSYLSGQHPIPPGDDKLLRLSSARTTMAEQFADAGFNTYGFSENPYVSEELGYSRGFDTFELMLPLESGVISSRRQEVSAQLLEGALNAIKSSGDNPWFTYVHLFRPHNPYYAPEPFGEAFMTEEGRAVASLEVEEGLSVGNSERDTYRDILSIPDPISYMINSYDGNLAYVDALVGRFLKEIEATGDLENTVIVIGSDHGESFMTHGHWGHGKFLYEEYVHVPLIIWAPALDGFKTGTVETPVAMLDVFPTLAEVFSLSATDTFDGDSLVPFLIGKSRPQNAIYSQTLITNKVSIRKEHTKLIATLNETDKSIISFRSYDLDSDPGERTDLWSNDGSFEELEVDLREYITAWPDPEQSETTPLTSDQIEQLEAVGYVH